jgi:hypothetical protein
MYLEGVRKELDDRNKQNKEELKRLSEGFENKITQIDELNENLNKEKIKLQNQK